MIGLMINAMAEYLSFIEEIRDTPFQRYICAEVQFITSKLII